MKIALGQVDMLFEDKKANYVMIEEFVSQAHDNQSEMIIFPEMTCTGFSMNALLIGERHHETVDYMKELSKAYHIIIAFGQVVCQNEKYYNNMTIVDGEDIIFSYDKIHPFLDEAHYYAKGNQIQTVKIQDLTISGFICYDLRFPEIFQIASKTCDVIIVIASWPDTRDDHWIALLKARAIENQCYVIGVNRVGYDKEHHYIGHSLVFDSFGQLMTRLSNEEDNIYVQITHDQVVQSRRHLDFKKDRREKLYLRLLEDHID